MISGRQPECFVGSDLTKKNLFHNSRCILLILLLLEVANVQKERERERMAGEAVGQFTVIGMKHE